MTALAAVVFPVIVIASGVAVLFSLAHFIADIRRGFREERSE